MNDLDSGNVGPLSKEVTLRCCKQDDGAMRGLVRVLARRALARSKFVTRSNSSNRSRSQLESLADSEFS